MIISVIGIAILAIIGFWLFGGVVLRVVGAVFVLVGLISLITLADPTALLMVVIGLVMWLAGHWHFRSAPPRIQESARSADLPPGSATPLRPDPPLGRSGRLRNDRASGAAS